MGDVVLHAAGSGAVDQPSIDRHPHVEAVGVGDLVARDDPGTDGVAGVEILALGGAHAERGFLGLCIPGAEVVEYRVAEYGVHGLFHACVLDAPADDDRQLHFVVQALGEMGPLDIRAMPNDAEAVAFVVKRPLIPHGGYGEHAAGLQPFQFFFRIAGGRGPQSHGGAQGLLDMQLVVGEVADLFRQGQGG